MGPSRYVFLLLPCILALGHAQGRAQMNPPPRPFSYDFSREDGLSRRIDPGDPDPEVLRKVFADRRARVLESIPEGALLVFSVEWVQPRRLEFQVPGADACIVHREPVVDNRLQ